MYADEVAAARCSAASPTTPTRSVATCSCSSRRAEERHAEHWARLLREAASSRSSRGCRSGCVRCASSRARFGTEAVLPLMLRTEAAEADRYRDDAEATEAMAQQEAAAGRTIAAMQGIPDGRPHRRARGSPPRRASAARCAPPCSAMNDGLVSNFSLVMGVAGGTSNNSFVLLAGVAGLVAGAFSMASGEWISIRSQRELYENELRIEQEELRAFPEEEREELEMIYRAKGIAPETRARSSTTS